MSTKNLARTAIEAGRRGYNKWERNYSHRQERVRARNYLTRVILDPELADEIVCEPRPVVMRDQLDKLNPVKGFLHSRVGRRWDDVHSEIVKRFDSRTIAGHHILYGHVLNHMVTYWYEVRPYGYGPSPGDFVVDEEGLLTEVPLIARPRARARNELADKQKKEIVRWLDNRLIITRGENFYWANPVLWNWEECQVKNEHQRTYSYWNWRMGVHRCSFTFEHKLINGSIHHRFPWRWSQGQRLMGREYYKWSQLSERVRSVWDYDRLKELWAW